MHKKALFGLSIVLITLLFSSAVGSVAAQTIAFEHYIKRKVSSMASIFIRVLQHYLSSLSSDSANDRGVSTSISDTSCH